MEKQQRKIKGGNLSFSLSFLSIFLLLLLSISFLPNEVTGDESSSNTSKTVVNADGSIHTTTSNGNTNEEGFCSGNNDENCQAYNHDDMNEDDIMIPMVYDDDDDEYDDEYNGDDDEYDEEEEDYEVDGDFDGVCEDEHENCEFWAKAGECKANPRYMLNSCRKSCGTCKDKSSYGLKQSMDDGREKEVLALIDDMEKYMEEKIYGNPELSYLAPRCKNRHADCAFWALEGECDANPNYMLTNCAPVCNTCHLLDLKTRCPIPDDAVDALKPGDLDKMFDKVLSIDGSSIRSAFNETDVNGNDDEDDETKLVVTVLSRPTYAPGDEGKSDIDYKIGPWVVTIDNFVKDEECDTLIDLGTEEGYKRSEDVGKEKFDGTFDSVKSSSRTSHNAWCVDDCYEHSTAQMVMKRMELLTGIPETNQENLQLLRYEEGQFYRTHHDYIEDQEEFPAGPRLMTSFLYLNDVEAGGGTDFPSLKITVLPKKGRILLWPSVLNDDPIAKDGRTTHQALPVEKGIKYAANAWVHMRDFKTPNDNGCT